MAEFNYTEYLRNNPLLNSEGKQPLTENQRPGYHPDGTPKSNDEMSDDEREDFYMNLDDVSEEKASSKMKVSELKAKIKEDIMSLLQEEEDDREDDELSPEELANKYAGSPFFREGIQEEEDLESELMADLNEVTGETLSRIDSLTNLSLKQKFLDTFNEIYSDMVESGDIFDVMDVIDYLCGEMQRFAEDTGIDTGNLEEAKKDEEDLEVEIEDDIEDDIEADIEGEDLEDEVGGGDAEALDPEAGLSQDEQDIQNALKVAYDNAVELGDEKLSKQIGNTITMFTRTRVVGDLN
jgi:hypothetical protein